MWKEVFVLYGTKLSTGVVSTTTTQQHEETQHSMTTKTKNTWSSNSKDFSKNVFFFPNKMFVNEVYDYTRYHQSATYLRTKFTFWVVSAIIMHLRISCSFL